MIVSEIQGISWSLYPLKTGRPRALAPRPTATADSEPDQKGGRALTWWHRYLMNPSRVVR